MICPYCNLPYVKGRNLQILKIVQRSDHLTSTQMAVMAGNTSRGRAIGCIHQLEEMGLIKGGWRRWQLTKAGETLLEKVA